MNHGNRNGRRFRRCRTILQALVIGAWVLASFGCGAGEVDSRCRIDAGSHSTHVANSVAKSKIWRVYFDTMTGTEPLVEIKVDVQRSRKRTIGGDYDAGTATVLFETKSLKHRRKILDHEGRFEIDSFLIGGFDKNASRDEMQEIAFQDAEKESYPYLERWINVAAIKAMGLEGKQGTAFVPTLKKLLEDTWISDDMKAATREALARIQGKA